MLVVSRKERETIVLPTIGATIELLQLKGNVARLGINAPRDLPILRGELIDENTPKYDPEAQKAAREREHALRNELNLATLGLNLLRQQLKAGESAQADATLSMLINKMGTLREEKTANNNGRHAPRALLVEDDANERYLLAGFLRSSGFEVESAGDGAEALTWLAASERPDMVLLDLVMPHCDGATTVRTIRRNPQFEGLKIFAVSGTSPGELGLATGPGGIDHWFQKPLDPERLISELQTALGIAV